MDKLQTLFQEYQNKKIALYGLGIETEKALVKLSHTFQIVGLLDGSRETGELYGRPIISMEEAIGQGIELILVVARPGSCKAIAKRIEKVCMENKIALFDIRGKNLLEEKKTVFHLKGLDGISKRELWERICQHEVISVDLFDTLIMRNLLFPTDVFDLLDVYLRKSGIFIKDFSKKRLESEKTLSRESAPTLTGIYQAVIDTYHIGGISAKTLADVEYDLDCGLLVRRQEMCELMEEAKKTGKEIYIVSDTYYTKPQLAGLLDRLNICFYTDLLVSCEYGTGKTQRLYEKFMEKIENRSCLHIGDDLTADVEAAEKYGIDTCRIYSGAELLENVGYLGMWDKLEGLTDHIRAGMFTARLFNSPFLFETEDRKLCVSRAEDIGYLFLAPMISDFVFWFAEKVKQYDLKNVWFGARDGYLIKRLYDDLKGDVSSVYFLTSRTAAVRAGMEREQDIQYVSEMQFSGTLAEQLKERFGISAFREREREDTGLIPQEQSLSDFSEEILGRAAVCRKNYRAYMKQLHIKEGDIAFFDFVAKGTSQMYIGRFVQNHIKGLYFLQLEEEYMQEKGLDIVPFYKQKGEKHSAVFDDYYIMETILTSPDPSVQEFDEFGEPCYAKETRTKEDISCFQAVQEGIVEFFRTYTRICPESERTIHREMDEQFFKLIHHISIMDKNFLGLTVEDLFFHRMTDITDLL